MTQYISKFGSSPYNKKSIPEQTCPGCGELRPGRSFKGLDYNTYTKCNSCRRKVQEEKSTR